MWGAHATECVFSKVHFTGSHILCKKHYDEKSQESQLRHVVQDVMQWQKTAHSLQAKSGGKHLRRHFRQHMVHWLIRLWCLYLLAWVQLFCLSTACTDSLSCQWVAFNACKVLCLRLTFMKYKQFMDCPNQFFKAPFCARAGREWYSTFSAILCQRRMASTWQILSSLHLLCDTTMVELSVHLYRQKGFTESLTKARATWSPVFKASWRPGNDYAPGLALRRMLTPPTLPLAAFTCSLFTSYLAGPPASACICTEAQNRHQRALWASISPKGFETAPLSWAMSLPHFNRAKMWWGTERKRQELHKKVQQE